jgi:hypothetical protein
MSQDSYDFERTPIGKRQDGTVVVCAGALLSGGEKPAIPTVNELCPL